MSGTALFSPCERYRYILTRKWGGMFNREGSCVFIMLNPSTADDQNDDPTIRRCIDFAKRWGHDGLTILNLFALRSTNPAALLGDADPVGPDNDRYIAEVCRTAGRLVVAWGAHEMAQARGLAVLTNLGHRASCLGLTQSGAPRHPLYVKADTPLVPFAGWPS